MEKISQFPIRMQHEGQSPDLLVEAVNQLVHSQDYVVVAVQPKDTTGLQGVSLHISRLNGVGPALFSLLLGDQELCTALADLCEQVERHRNGLSTPWV